MEKQKNKLKDQDHTYIVWITEILERDNTGNGRKEELWRQ